MLVFATVDLEARLEPMTYDFACWYFILVMTYF